MIQRLALDGPWKLLPVDSFHQGFYPLDDSAWVEQRLPAHWQQLPIFARYTGKMVYRTELALAAERAAAPPDARWWLRLNGIFYWSQAYFNGVDLGHHEGYFVPQEREVTRWLADTNQLLIETECVDELDKLNKRQITGVFSHWDCLDPASNPGGVWLPIELIRSGPTRVVEVLLHTEHVSTELAELRFRAVLDAAHASDALLRWTFSPKNFSGAVQVVEQRRALAEGRHEITGLLQLRDPHLWWTHDMGQPNCYTVTLAVSIDQQLSDEHAFTFGIRQFTMRSWIPHLNGVRLFVKGSNYGPGDARIATMTRAAFDRDFQLVRGSHMNMLRVHGHVEHPEFYEAANEAGVLLWQDFPLQWLYSSEILPQARAQAQRMARLLYNHPALVIWCMHNESLHLADTNDERLLSLLRTLVSAIFSNWNRRVMDTELKRTVETEDRTRPVVRSSGEFALSPLHPGTDTHFYNGWYYLTLRSWETIARRLPNNVRFVTEFGAQSFPNLESSLRFISADIRQINWDDLVAHRGLQLKILERWVNWRGASSLAELIQLTQDYQIEMNRFYIDRLRYYKYRPTGGVVPFLFHDSQPAVQWSIVDYWRVPKRSYDAMRLAFSPQYLFSLIDRDFYALGERIDLPIYLVNDAHRPVPVTLQARLIAPDGAQLASIDRELTLPPDCMTMEIERLRLTPTVAGTYRLELRLSGSEASAHAQHYDVAVVTSRRR